MKKKKKETQLDIFAKTFESELQRQTFELSQPGKAPVDALTAVINAVTKAWSVAKGLIVIICFLFSTQAAAATALLAWEDNAANETQTTVYRQAKGATLWTPIAKLGADAVTYSDPLASDGDCYKVTMGNSLGESSPTNTACFQIAQAPPPSCIPSYVPGCSLTVMWNDLSTNEDGFYVWRKLNAGTYGVTALAKTGPSIKSYVDTSMVQGTVVNRYCYAVSSFNTAGGSALTTDVACYDVPALPPVITIPNAPSGTVLK